MPNLCRSGIVCGFPMVARETYSIVFEDKLSEETASELEQYAHSNSVVTVQNSNQQDEDENK